MIPIIDNIVRHEVQELTLRNGKPVEGKFLEQWTMRIIISVAFGDTLEHKWMADSYHEYVGNQEMHTIVLNKRNYEGSLLELLFNRSSGVLPSSAFQLEKVETS
jgi:hypothetical protein